MPAAPVALAFVTGIGSAPITPPPLAWLGWSGAVVAAGWFLYRGPERRAAAALLAAVAALGALRAARPALPPNHLAFLDRPGPVRLEGRVAAEPVPLGPERARLLLAAERLVAGDRAQRVTGLVQLTMYGALGPVAVDQRVVGDVRLHPPRNFRNPGGFDYVAHLARQDIHVVGSGRGDRMAILTTPVRSWNAETRRWARDTIERALPPVSAALLAGLLLGERSALPPEVHDAFRRAGVYHVLAVSGFNVALVAVGVHAMLRLFRLPRRAAASGALTAVGAFAAIVGPEPSVLRAVLTAALVLGGMMLEREPAPLNSLAVAAIAILVLRPGDLRDPGFQLSFAATAGIVALTRPIEHGLTGRGWPRWLATASGASLAAQLAVAPILLHHFNQLSLAGAIANLAVVPLAAVATLGGLIALGAAAADDALGRVLLDGVWPALLAMRGTVYLAARLPGAAVYLPATPWPAALAWYVGLVTLVASRRPSPHAPGGPRPAEVPGPPRYGARGVAVALLGIAGLAGLWPAFRPADGRLRVAFLDVGQGDATVVELPDGQALVVDAGAGGPGRFDVGERVVAPYLWNRGLRRLATLVVTHADADHAGGASALRRLFRVEREWTGDTVQAGLREMRSGVGITVLNPIHAGDPRSARRERGHRNDDSVVIRLDYGRVSLLLVADIEEEAERRLLAARSPVGARLLKVAHHGARGSTGEAFLRAARPAAGVVSVGARNPYGHPAPATLARLHAAGVRIYRTDEDGAVIVETDGREVTITTWADRRTERLPLP